MRRAAILVILVGLGGCDEPAPPRAVFELRPVVAQALAEFGPEFDAAIATPAGPAPVPAAVLEAVPEDVLGLLDTLGSPRASMREVALAELRQRGDPVVGSLAGALADASLPDALRSAAVEALSILDTPASVDVLVRTLTQSGTPWIRSQCAWRLGDSGQDRFQPRILLRLRYESDDETAIWLGSALARQGNYAGIDGMLVVLARARTPELAQLALGELARLAGEAGAADGAELRRQWELGELERRRPPPAPSRELLHQAWKNIESLKEWDLRVVDDRRFMLSRSNVWVVELLAQALHEEDVYVRVHAAQCLERMGPRAAGALGELLQALDEPRLAPAAAAALGALREAGACERLETCLVGRDVELACAAARALGQIGAARSGGPLRRAFSSGGTPDLRQAAAESLLALEDPDTVEVLRFLGGRLADPLAESAAAEAALGAWLARRAAVDAARFAPRLQAWRDADGLPAGAIATREQAAARLAQRAALVAGW